MCAWWRGGGGGLGTGLEVELDVCVFFLFGAVVVRAALDAVYLLDGVSSNRSKDCLHLDVAQLELCRRVLVRGHDTQRNQHTHAEGHGCKETKHILYPYQR